MKISEATDQPLKIILHSPSGRGKTALATTLGECAQIIDIDLGTETARKFQDQFSGVRGKVDWLPCPEPAPLQAAVAFSKAKDYIIAISNAIFQKKWPFKVLIVDSFTSAADGAIRYVMHNNGRLNRPAIVPRGKDMGGGISQPEWGLMITELENFVLLLRGLPCHVVMIAHTVPVKDQNDFVRQEISIPTQKLPPRIPGYFDEIWYIDYEEKGGGVRDRVLRTVEQPQFIAKSRAGLPDKTDVNLGLPEIFKRLGRSLE